MSQFGGEGTIEIDAGRDHCFAVAADAEHYPDWHPVIKSMEVLDRDADGRAATANLVVDASVSGVTVQVGFSYKPPESVECQRQAGDLNEMWTRFELTDLGSERTRLDYSTGL